MIRKCVIFMVVGIMMISIVNCAAAGSSDRKKQRIRALYDRFEGECIQKGWQQFSVQVDNATRKIIWKGPGQEWRKGAIIALHGGGGTYSNFCANIRIGKPMVDFSAMAISEGFAIFSLESDEGLLTDKRGDSCGKRWLSMAENNKKNPDLAFIKKVITDVIPQMRPAQSSKSIFMTGISNGGFMTVLAASHFSDKITAFAPVSAGDPYGIYVDCGKGSAFRSTPGLLIDRDTHKPINEKDACKSEKYINEKKWIAAKSPDRPPFKLFYHMGDSVDDTSCKIKLQRQLVSNGFQDDGSFILGDKSSTRWPLNHFWKHEYNKPVIDFFKKYAKKAKK
jgi:poly(3-hydroxybutyrate) depolymerase